MGVTAAGIAAFGTLAAAGIGAASSAGAFGGGNAGTAGGIDADEMRKLIASYQKMVDEGVSEYQGNIGSAIGNFNSVVDSSLDQYTGGMTRALKQFSKRQANATKSYVKNVNKLTTNPMGQYVLPAVGQALQFNTDNSGAFGDLARKLTVEDQQTRFAELDSAIPTWRTSRDKAAEINQALLNGEVPTDVKQQIARSAAFKSLQGGFGASSGMGRALSARDLGLTTLDLQQQGQQNVESWDQLLYNIAVPQQTTAADVMRFSGVSADTAAQAGLAGMSARVGAQAGAFQGRLNTNTNTLGTTAAVANNVLGTQTTAARDVFGAQTTAARDVFGARTAVAENTTNFGSGLQTRLADDSQAAANFGLQQSSAVSNDVAAGIGGLSSALSDYFKKKALDQKLAAQYGVQSTQVQAALPV